MECAHENILLAIVPALSIIIIHNFLVDVNDDLNATLEPVIDTAAGIEEDDYYNLEIEEPEDMSTQVILLRHIKYLNEDVTDVACVGLTHHANWPKGTMLSGEDRRLLNVGN